MSHAPYIAAAYASTVAVVGGLVVWVVAAHRRLTRALAEAEAAGSGRK